MPSIPGYRTMSILTEQIANVVGAKPTEVVAMNGLTVNLHLMMVSFYRPTPQRHKILMEAQPFPSDRYAVASQIRYHGFDPAQSLIECQPRPGEKTLRTEDIERLIEQHGGSIALILSVRSITIQASFSKWSASPKPGTLKDVSWAGIWLMPPATCP